MAWTAKDEAIRAQAIALIVIQAEELGYCDDDVAAFQRGEFDGDDVLTLQAVERALRTKEA